MLERYEAGLGKEGDLLGGSFWKGISFVRGGGAAVIWMSLMHNRGEGWGGSKAGVLENRKAKLRNAFLKITFKFFHWNDFLFKSCFWQQCINWKIWQKLPKNLYGSCYQD